MQADCLQPRLRLLAAGLEPDLLRPASGRKHSNQLSYISRNGGKLLYRLLCASVLAVQSGLEPPTGFRQEINSLPPATNSGTEHQIVIQLSKNYALSSNTFHIILLLDIIVNKFPPLWIRTTNFCVLSTAPLPVGVMEVFGASGEIRTLMPFDTATSRLRACHFHHRCKKSPRSCGL